MEGENECTQARMSVYQWEWMSTIKNEYVPAIMDVCISKKAFRGVWGPAVEVVESEDGEARAVNSTDLEKW